MICSFWGLYSFEEYHYVELIQTFLSHLSEHTMTFWLKDKHHAPSVERIFNGLRTRYWTDLKPEQVTIYRNNGLS